jgi:hypothetical protein
VDSFAIEAARSNFMEEVIAFCILSEGWHLEDIFLDERTRTGCKNTITDSGSATKKGAK